MTRRQLLPAAELASYRRLFPVTQAYAYLNHAALGPLPTAAYQAGERHLRQQRDGGYESEATWLADLEEARGLAARLMGAAAGEIAFVKNTTSGLLLVANGLAWREGDVVVTVSGEFPANVVPWQNLRPKGVEVRFVPVESSRVRLEDVRRALDGRARLLTVSFVEFATGFRNDLAALGELCADRDVLLCVDAIQGLGALPLDVRSLGIDFLAAGGHKWLLSPLGTGLFYCRPERLELLGPAMLGWYSVQDPDSDYFRYDLPLKENALRFEESARVFGPLLSLGASLGLLLQVGIERIEAHLLALLDRLIDGLEARGYELGSPVSSDAERSGILCFGHRRRPAEAVRRRLEEAGVLVARRGDALRVSPHFYNAPEEIDRLLEALP